MNLTYWLLSPYLLSWFAFLSAYIVRLRLDSNRSLLDLNLALVGFGLLAVGVACSLVMLILFPYKSATARQWLGFALHCAALVISLLVASEWLGSHIA